VLPDAARVSAPTNVAAQDGRGSVMGLRNCLIGIGSLAVFLACVASAEGR